MVADKRIVTKKYIAEQSESIEKKQRDQAKYLYEKTENDLNENLIS